MTDKKELKDYSVKELADEIALRRDFMIVITEKEMIAKQCDLYKLCGLISKANMEIMMLLKQSEMQKKTGGIIVPRSRIPGGFRKH